MSDDTARTALDRKLMSLKEDYEVCEWCQSLGCTPQQLRAAVKAVGNSLDAVRQHLARKQ